MSAPRSRDSLRSGGSVEWERAKEISCAQTLEVPGSLKMSKFHQYLPFGGFQTTCHLGKSKRGLSILRLGPKGAKRAQKGLFFSRLRGAEESVPSISPKKTPIGPEKAPIRPGKALLSGWIFAGFSLKIFGCTPRGSYGNTAF